MKMHPAVPITTVAVLALLLFASIWRPDPDTMAAERLDANNNGNPATESDDSHQNNKPQPKATGNPISPLEQHLEELVEKLPGDDFHIVVQYPFVVIGDEEKAVVQQRASSTIHWAIDRLKRDFFPKDPTHIIDIWLFKDKDSYETNVKALFDQEPHTRFGYYSPSKQAIVMNISTGTGTLVHEIVHPFMAANFPNCPAWFNEGLASLYEQCCDRHHHIWGLTNWRLPGLQDAIRSDEGLPSFESLCNTTDHEFYTEDSGTNYAQARYLCYYLQEHGKLISYYHEFRREQKNDPGGYRTLVRILGTPDMEEFHERWEEYVLGLEF
jgi:hypothetical protein